ncbi:MAG: glucose 1-dehydrogenase [Chloroflexota bacterium]|nr:MAG: glucose 1-dehydrogenase [Chloroflexota bacterium]
MYRLDGKVALVTGAGRGIGRAIALRLAQEGADVVIADLDEASAKAVAVEAMGIGRRALGIAADVTEAAAIGDLVARATSDVGEIDILVNNAGINIIAPFLELTEKQWDALFDINIKSYWLCAKAVAPRMIARGQGGKIINAASRAGKTPSRLSPTGAYATTKHAVIGFTRALAFELAPHRINVNAYCPGVVDTPMWDLIDSEVARRTGAPPGSTKARAIAEIPLGRVQVPEDVANLVAFLASSQSDYMTGQAINITGGSEIH